ncbi:unnamed protein product [Brassicogethes aeneus]|uniref:Calcium uniporter protein n=1 Tax=Brassicogethes aeneus TaxID=1431903 RepID=A0A9P0B682_BRAAE|nr:unnamed protein product [Brassicogethes aeneus]
MALPRVLCRVRLFRNNEFSVVAKYPSFVKSVPINKSVQVQVLRHFRTHLTTVSVPNTDQKHKLFEQKDSSSSSSSSSSSESDSDSDENDVTVEYHKGLPQITVPLPSRKEKCRFTVKPISNTVGDFLEMLRNEDKGIDRVVIKARDGTRIASSNTIESLLDDDFRLIINDCSYNVNTPKQERLTGEEVQRLDDVKNLISQLYEALQVREHHMTKEQELTTQLETLQQELLPLEEKKAELELVAQRKSNWLSWTGLGLMSVQFGILARLTWWEYSWDIMEPVTYFVTYGTAMAAYAYFVLTKEEYILADVKDRQHLITLHKKSKKLGLDLNQYNLLREQISKVNLDLRKVRKKRNIHFPAKPALVSPGAPAVLQAVPIEGVTVKDTVTVKEEVAQPDAKKSSETSAKDEIPPKK